MKNKEQISIPDFTKAKREALHLLDMFGYLNSQFELPVDPIKIARTLGVNVYFTTFTKEQKNISGFFNVEENAIYVNKEEDLLRQISTVAHELGHKRLHESWLLSSEHKILLRDQLIEPQDPIEQEANIFATHLLVPKIYLDRYKKMATVSKLARLFGVAEPIVQQRIKDND